MPGRQDSSHAPTLSSRTKLNSPALDTALGVVIDGSTSINNDDFQTQKNAYADVFGDPSIVPENNSIALNIYQFSGTDSFEPNVQQELDALRIGSGDRSTVVSAFNDMDQLTGNTAIGDGIEDSQENMDTFLDNNVPDEERTDDFEKIIDVSTDGEDNASDISPGNAVDNAIADGYSAVNCLAIGTGDCSFIGNNGDVFSAENFDELENTLETKVRQEVDRPEPVPMPTTLGLVGMGLFGLGIVGYRRKSTA